MVAVNQADEFDFIVVGGGTAGCAVAGRLAEKPSVKVLVIEAGAGNPGEIDAINTPARAFELRGGVHDWGYKTGMIDRPEYTRVEKPNTRGKVLGGSSCLNYYTWIPGSKATFDEWEAWGGVGWNWDGVKEYLYKPATYLDDSHTYRADLKYLGAGGPIKVSHSDLLPETHEFRTALSKAWVSKGGELTDDVHNGTMRGLWASTNSIYNGKRSSSWHYLEGKSNVTVMDRAHAKRILLEGTKAVGVEVISAATGETVSLRAKHEVILSMGVYESPKLLMLSGVGPKDTLAKFGIKAVVPSEHVGQNLLDHPIMPHVFKLKDGTGLDHHILQPGPEKDAAVSAYTWKNAGPMTSGLLEMVGLPRIDDRLEKHPAYLAAKKANGGLDPFGPGGQPHFEVDFVPMFCDAFQWHFPTPSHGNYLTVIVDLLRPLSKNGVVSLKTADPLEQADININFFSNELDLIALVEGVRHIDDMLKNGEGMKDLIEGEYPWALPLTSTEAMVRQILERSQTGFHPCGTTRMAPSIDKGVVNGKLQVHGLSNLRVIDASVFPVIPDCRIQNSVYAVAEKGADLVKADYPKLYQ